MTKKRKKQQSQVIALKLLPDKDVKSLNRIKRKHNQTQERYEAARENYVLARQAAIAIFDKPSVRPKLVKRNLNELKHAKDQLKRDLDVIKKRLKQKEAEAMKMSLKLVEQAVSQSAQKIAALLKKSELPEQKVELVFEKACEKLGVDVDLIFSSE